MAKHTALKRIVGICGALVLVGLLAACGSSGPVLAVDAQDDGSLVATANKCKSDGMVVTSIEVAEGQGHIVVSSEDLQGVLHVGFGEPISGDMETNVADLGVDTENFLFMTDAMGTSEASFEVEPGFYSLTIWGDDAEPATGAITIAPTE